MKNAGKIFLLFQFSRNSQCYIILCFFFNLISVSTNIILIISFIFLQSFKPVIKQYRNTSQRETIGLSGRADGTHGDRGHFPHQFWQSQSNRGQIIPTTLQLAPPPDFQTAGSGPQGIAKSVRTKGLLCQRVLFFEVPSNTVKCLSTKISFLYRSLGMAEPEGAGELQPLPPS